MQGLASCPYYMGSLLTHGCDMAEAARQDAGFAAARYFRRLGEKLGAPHIDSERDLVRFVERRGSYRMVERFVKEGLTDKEVYALIIPRRTLTHRRSRDEALTQEETERAVRVARITALAEEVFGSDEKALRWLRKPKRRLEGRAPLDLLKTEPGGRIVEEMLHRVDDGVFA